MNKPATAEIELMSRRYDLAARLIQVGRTRGACLFLQGLDWLEVIIHGWYSMLFP